MRKPLSFLIVLAVFSQACSKKSVDMPEGPLSGSVYVTGDDGTNPILWVDGKAQTLATNGGFGAQVLLDGGDVYVAGVSNEGTSVVLTPAGPSGQYAYWKNGSETKIGTPRFLESPIAIAVNGNDVFYSGGGVYENGSAVSLQGLGAMGFVCAAQTIGGDVYLAGRDSIGNGAYWKNGELHMFAPTQPLGSGIQIYCMYVTPNGDVYVGGSDLGFRGAIWKNGVESMPQSSGGADALFNVKAIFVDGADVYSISNLVVSNGGNAPAYWKNGVQVNLPLDGATYGNATSIFVSGGDVYVTGTTTKGAVLWKNGVSTLLAAGGEATSVTVK